ncbi:MAG: hypothetical protein OES09_00045 [Gammaproteobacteria bacterium]|nr:hypothetical protein [Gammaproteobacteria bacterium]
MAQLSPGRADLKNKIKEHAEKVREERGLTPVEVPEWGCTLYYGVINMRSKLKIFRLQQEGDIHSLAQIVVECALDEKGRRVFNGQSDVDWLMSDEADSEVVIRLSTELAPALSGNVRSVEKKSESADSSGSDTISPTD